MNTCELFLVLPAPTMVQVSSISTSNDSYPFMIFTLSLAAFVVYYFILDLDLQILLVEKSRSLEVNM